jgi:undecaprenyl-diphosphatase
MQGDAHVDVGTAIVLGVVQGITEFLPVSSDGHLAVASWMFGAVSMPLSMVVLLHVGTLIATLWVFRADVRTLVAGALRGLRAPRPWLASLEGREAAAIVVASVPTAAVGLALRDSVEAWSHIPWVVGLCLLGTALAVGSTRWSGQRASSEDAVLSLRNAAIIGLAQGLAVLPGLSRSGSTIACAMLLGSTAPAAFRFSFLASLPAVTGAVLLELRHPGDVLETLGAGALLGAVVSFVVGLGALLTLERMVSRGRFWAFSAYLVPLALGLMAWDLAR